MFVDLMNIKIVNELISLKSHQKIENQNFIFVILLH